MVLHPVQEPPNICGRSTLYAWHIDHAQRASSHAFSAREETCSDSGLRLLGRCSTTRNPDCPESTSSYKQSMYATKSTTLVQFENQIEGFSSAGQRPSCKLGAESLMPRNGKVLIGPSGRPP